MSLMNILIGSTSSNAVALPSINFANDGTGKVIYSGVRFGSDGNIYRMSEGGTWQVWTQWLVKGAASSYYLFRTINSGTLVSDSGTGVQMSTTRSYYLTSSIEEKTASIDFTISTSTTGTPVVAGPRLYNLYALAY